MIFKLFVENDFGDLIWRSNHYGRDDSTKQRESGGKEI